MNTLYLHNSCLITQFAPTSQSIPTLPPSPCLAVPWKQCNDAFPRDNLYLQSSKFDHRQLLLHRFTQNQSKIADSNSTFQQSRSFILETKPTFFCRYSALRPQRRHRHGRLQFHEGAGAQEATHRTWPSPYRQQGRPHCAPPGERQAAGCL